MRTFFFDRVHMEWAVLALLALAIALLGLAAHMLKPSESGEDTAEESEDAAEGEEELDPLHPGLRGRGALMGLGKKKAEKLRQKDERRQAREAMLERQKREKEERTLARVEEDEREAALEQQEREQRQKQLEDQVEREDEDYYRWRSAMAVEEAGCQEEGEELLGPQDLLDQFLQEVRDQKVCILEDLGAKFEISVKRVVQLLEDLQEQELLMGVFDDRGKYISVTQAELQQLARFVNQRGRVSIEQITSEANRCFLLHQSGA